MLWQRRWTAAFVCLACSFFPLSDARQSAVGMFDLGISDDSGSPTTPCFRYDPDWGPLPNGSAQVVFAEPALGCSNNLTYNITNGPQFAGKWAVFDRGLCNFTTKLEAAIFFNALGVVVVNSDGRDWITPSRTNFSQFNGSSISMGMVSSGARPLFLAAAASQRNVSVSAVPPAMIDANLALFLAVALSVISIGNFWGTAPQREMAFRRGDGMLSVNNRANRATNSANATSVGGSREQPEQEQQAISTKAIACLLVAATVVLLLMYFLYKYVVYLFIFLFGLGSAVATARCLSLLLAKVIPSEKQPSTTVRWVGKVTLGEACCALLGLGLGITWGVLRNESMAWILQDILGFFMLCSFLETIYITSLKTATYLAVAFLLYDVFMVFITPLITANHDSIMVKAATGGGTSSESMPLLFMIPRLSAAVCNRGLSMLGFGDIIVPGILVGLGLRVDVGNPRMAKRKFHYPLFALCLLAYAVGLMVCYAAMSLMRRPQPALLYLNPSITIALWGWGLSTGAWRDMWNGPTKVASPTTVGRQRPSPASVEDGVTASAVAESSPSETEDENAPLIVT